MDGQTFWLVFWIACLAIVCASGLFIRDLPADRSAIDDFSEQCGLRIISVTHLYNFFRFWFRGVCVGNALRFYRVTAEDSAGNRGDINVAFDSLFGPGQLVVLEQHGLVFTLPGGSVSLTQPGSMTRPSWSRPEQLLLFVIGAGIGGVFFAGILHTNLSPPNRPIFPEPALGYTHLFKAKHGYAYGTFFEYVAVTYGIWIMWIACAAAGAILKFTLKARTSFRWQVFAAIAISMALYYAIWRLSIYVARL